MCMNCIKVTDKQGLEKSWISPCTWDKYLSNIACIGQVLVCYFKLAHDLLDILPIGQVRIKSLGQKENPLVWDNGKTLFLSPDNFK